jgi:hypothetical protein
MANLKPFVELKTSTGTPIKKGNMTITPEAQALVVKLPYCGFVWNRPVAMLVEMDGRRERFPIFDVTRAAVLAMAGAGVALSLGAVLVRIFGRGMAKD